MQKNKRLNNNNMSLLQGFHKHHIIPKYLGGTDDEQNLVLLHPIDHAIHHFVRYKLYKNVGDLRAYNLLQKFTGLDSGFECNQGENNPNYGNKWTLKMKENASTQKKGKKQSAETIQKRIEKTKGQWRPTQSEYMKQRWAERKAKNIKCRIGFEEK